MTDEEIRLFSELESHVTAAKQYLRLAKKNNDNRQKAGAHLQYVEALAKSLRQP